MDFYRRAMEQCITGTEITVPVILGEIRQLFRSGGSVKVSRSMQELSMRAKKLCDNYRREHDGEMKISELAE